MASERRLCKYCGFPVAFSSNRRLIKSNDKQLGRRRFYLVSFRNCNNSDNGTRLHARAGSWRRYCNTDYSWYSSDTKNQPIKYGHLLWWVTVLRILTVTIIKGFYFIHNSMVFTPVKSIFYPFPVTSLSATQLCTGISMHLISRLKDCPSGDRNHIPTKVEYFSHSLI